MQYNTKLNEFSTEQLDYYLKVVKAEIEDLYNAQLRLELWDDSEVKTENLKEVEFKLDAILLLKVQLNNAKKDHQVLNQ